jgi:lysozyme
VGATFYEDGRRVTMSDPAITAARAEQLLQWMLRTQFLPEVLRLCHGIETPGQLGALVDFAYNCGVGNLRASTLRKRVNAGRWDDVPAEFRKWNRGGSKVLRGLVRRREAEIALL